MHKEPFWKSLTLDDMSAEQWESLCDGCGRCCLQKLQDEENSQIYYTNVVCQYLSNQGRCSHYQERQQLVPDCVWLRPEDASEFHWLPDTCAYRLLAQGKPLPDWHPLITGDQISVRTAGISVLCHTLIRDNELKEEDWQNHLIDWVQYD